MSHMTHFEPTNDVLSYGRQIRASVLHMSLNSKDVHSEGPVTGKDQTEAIAEGQMARGQGEGAVRGGRRKRGRLRWRKEEKLRGQRKRQRERD